MDSTKFDDLTKVLATSTSRREALKTITATTIAGLFALSGLDTVFAKKKCPPGLTACHGKCVDLNSDPNHCGSCRNTCGSGVCCQGVCCATTGAVCCPISPTSITCCAPGAQCCSGVCRAPGTC